MKSYAGKLTIPSLLNCYTNVTNKPGGKRRRRNLLVSEVDKQKRERLPPKEGCSLKYIFGFEMHRFTRHTKCTKIPYVLYKDRRASLMYFLTEDETVEESIKWAILMFNLSRRHYRSFKRGWGVLPTWINQSTHPQPSGVPPTLSYNTDTVH